MCAGRLRWSPPHAEEVPPTWDVTRTRGRSHVDVTRVRLPHILTYTPAVYPDALSSETRCSLHTRLRVSANVSGFICSVLINLLHTESTIPSLLSFNTYRSMDCWAPLLVVSGETHSWLIGCWIHLYLGGLLHAIWPSHRSNSWGERPSLVSGGGSSFPVGHWSHWSQEVNLTTVTILYFEARFGNFFTCALWTFFAFSIIIV